MALPKKMETEIRKAIESVTPLNFITAIVEGDYNRDEKASKEISKARRDWLNAVASSKDTNPFVQICAAPPEMPKIKKPNSKKKS